MKSKFGLIVGSVLALAITATEPVMAKGSATVHTLGCDCIWKDPVQLRPQVTITSKSNVLIVGTALRISPHTIGLDLGSTG